MATEFDVTSFRAVGDGQTDCTDAFTQAIQEAASAVLKVPRGKFMVRQLTLANVRVVGEDGTVLTGIGDGPAMLRMQSASSLRGLFLHAPRTDAAAIIRVAPGANHVAIEGCILRGSSAVGIEMQQDTNSVHVVDSILDEAGVKNSIRIIGGNDISVQRCTIMNWSGRAIYVQGTEQHSSKKVRLVENKIVNLAHASPPPRHPIQFTGIQSRKHEDVHVVDNTVIGEGRSWTAKSNPGTADQISLMQVKNFLVAGNTSELGGDVGITISTGCEQGRVENNVVRFNDTNGIFIHASDVYVTDNTVLSNGQNRENDRGKARAGIGVRQADNIRLTGNVSDDPESAPTQIAGFRIRGSRSVTLEKNVSRHIPEILEE